MIIGIGTDIIEIDRFDAAVENQNFMQKYFTQNEIEFFNSRKNKANIVAGNFAVKESVSKALGTGFVGFSPIDIEVCRVDTGKPYINLYGEAYNLSIDLGIKKFHVTISHCKGYAVAYVIAEGDIL